MSTQDDRWPLARHVDLLRYGPDLGRKDPAERPGRRARKLKNLSACTSYDEPASGTAGHEYQYRSAVSKSIVQHWRQQGRTLTEVTEALLNPRNVGGLWVRRQDDPEAAVETMWDEINPDLLPYLPMVERHARIFDALRRGETTQTGIVRAVGHAKDWDVRADLAELERQGAIYVERAQHGQSRYLWWTARVAVGWRRFQVISMAIRRELAQKIAASRAKAREIARSRAAHLRKGLPVGETDPDLAAHEIRQRAAADEQANELLGFEKDADASRVEQAEHAWHEFIDNYVLDRLILGWKRTTSDRSPTHAEAVPEFMRFHDDLAELLDGTAHRSPTNTETVPDVRRGDAPGIALCAMSGSPG